MKKLHRIGVKLSEQEREAVETAARSENISISQYVRRCTVGGTAGSTAVVHGGATAPASASPRVYNVDDLGTDPLRGDNGALAR